MRRGSSGDAGNCALADVNHRATTAAMPMKVTTPTTMRATSPGSAPTGPTMTATRCGTATIRTVQAPPTVQSDDASVGVRPESLLALFDVRLRLSLALAG